MNYWVGVIAGCACSTILFTILMFSVIEQNKVLQSQVKELSEKVDEHEKIMRAYEFYNWHNMKMFDEKEEK